MDQRIKLSNKQKINLIYLLYLSSQKSKGSKYIYSYDKYLKIARQISEKTQLHLIIKKIISDGNQAQSIGKSIKYQTYLTKISLDILANNNFGSEGMASLSKAFPRLLHLEEFNLRIYENNNIEALGCQVFGKSLKYLTSLKILMLKMYSNPLGQKGIIHIVDGIKELISLNTLNLDLFDANISFKEICDILLSNSELRVNEMKFKFKVEQNQIDKAKLLEYGQQIEKVKTFPNLSRLQLIQENNRVFISNEEKVIEVIAQQKDKFKLNNMQMIRIYQLIDQQNEQIDINKIRNAKNLRVSFSSQYGINEADSILKFLDQFTSLVKLTIAINHRFSVDETCARNIGEILAKNKQISILKLEILNPNIHLVHAEIIMEGLKHCSGLKRMILNINNPTGFLFIAILNSFKSIYKKQAIKIQDRFYRFQRDPKTLDVSQLNYKLLAYPLGDQGSPYIACVLKHLSTITILKLLFTKENQITSQGYGIVGQGVKYLQNLTQFNIIIRNLESFDDSSFVQFTSGIGKAKMIQNFVIDLGDCHLTTFSSIRLFEMLGELNKLTHLEINHFCRMIGFAYESELVECLERIKHLRYLSLNQNDIALRDCQVYMLASWIKQLQNLQEFCFLETSHSPQMSHDVLFQLFQGLATIKFSTLKIHLYQNLQLFFYHLKINQLQNFKELNLQIKPKQEQTTLFDDFATCIESLTNLQKITLKLDPLPNLPIEQLQTLNEAFKKLRNLTFIDAQIYFKNSSSLYLQKQISIFLNLEYLTIFIIQFYSREMFKKAKGIIQRKNKRLVKLY